MVGGTTHGVPRAAAVTQLADQASRQRHTPTTAGFLQWPAHDGTAEQLGMGSRMRQCTTDAGLVASAKPCTSAS
jgi:hypothetical protein